MNSTLRRFVPFLLFVLLLVLCWQGLQKDPSRLDFPLLNQPVPLLDRHDVFLGTISVIHVFTTDNPYWKIEKVLLYNLNQNGVQIVGINFKDNGDAIQNRLWEKNPYHKIISDPTGKFGLRLGVRGAPETFLVDSKGIIRYHFSGPLTWENLQNDLLPLIEKFQRERK